jgi:hypothetical protein
MLRKLVTATVSAALCTMSVMPGVAAAQDYRFGGFEAPRGATATVNLRIPFGRQDIERPNYGLTLGYGQTVGPQTFDGRTTTRGARLADLRFNESGALRNARLAGLDLANLDQDRRMNLVGPGKKTWLVIGGIIVAGILICVAADCFGDDEEDFPT